MISSFLEKFHFMADFILQEENFNFYLLIYIIYIGIQNILLNVFSGFFKVFYYY